MKKLLNVIFSVALAMTLVLGAAAAPVQNTAAAPDPKDYTVHVTDGKVQFVRNGAVIGSYEAVQPVTLVVHTDKDGDLLVLFTQPDGKRMNITLQKQKNLTLEGKLGGLLLDKSLSSEVAVSIAPTASVDKLDVRSDSPVSVGGAVGSAVVSGASKVSLNSGASVSTLRVTNPSAKVQASSGAAVRKASSVKKSALSGIRSVQQISQPSSGDSGSGSSKDWSLKDSSSKSGSQSSGSSSPSIPTTPPVEVVPPQPGPDVPDQPGVPDQPDVPDQPVVPPQPDVPDQPADVSIQNVYPTAMNVRVELSSAVALDASAFYISCPVGKDMTILSVETVSGADKNRVYQIHTAHYSDNDYILEITLPGGKKLTQPFTTDSNLPDAASFKAERLSGDTAQFSFTSDIAGKVYYIAVDGAKSRAAIGTAVPQSALEIKQKGESGAVIGGLNQYQITGLTPGVPYSIYMVLADTTDSFFSDILPVQAVPAAPAVNPDAGDITIQSVEQIKNNGFRVVLSKPTAQPLEIGAFYAKCPAQAALHLGRVETADNKTYNVYLQDGWFYMASNTYEIKVTFPDGSVATGSVYAETYPAIGLIEGKRYTDGSVVVTFNSDKPGKIYYGTVPAREDKPKLDWVLANGAQGELFAGRNELKLDNVPADHYHFYMVAIDQKGNAPVFVDGGKIEDTGTSPDGGNTSGNEITSIGPSTQSSVAGPVTVLNVTFKEPINFTSIDSSAVTFTAISGGSANVLRVIGVSGGVNTVTASEVKLSLNAEIPAGSVYKITIVLYDGTKISGQFSVGQAQPITLGYSE